MSDFEKAKALIQAFKGDRYVFGVGALARTGELVARLGQRAVLICGRSAASQKVGQEVKALLSSAGVTVASELQGAGPNAPREDVTRLAGELLAVEPGVIVVIGGGSAIDAAKAAEVLRTLGGVIDDYFGTGRVTKRLEASGRALTPVVAIQMAASSSAHLTKYSNITDVETGQKKLIVDDAIVPSLAIFDYSVTQSMPPELTADGAFDGVSHVLEVLYGSVGKPYYGKMVEVAGEAIELVVKQVERAVKDPDDTEARFALGLATDLGGYAIMLGGTNGGHLTSFSLVDILSHGRACAIMNPYYTVFFAPAVEEPLRMVFRILQDGGLTDVDVEAPITCHTGRELGVAVAEAMMALSKRIGLPTTLSEVRGFTNEHIERALTAAKDPQLKMKLENMPVPLTAEMVDRYMRPILEAARDGDLTMIVNVPESPSAN